MRSHTASNQKGEPTERAIPAGERKIPTAITWPMITAANQAASLKHYPPYSWSGGSQIVDFEGRMLADASPGPGERIVVAPIDISALRHERQARRGHQMLAHLRTEAYPVYRENIYPPERDDAELSYERNNALIDESKRRSAFKPSDTN